MSLSPTDKDTGLSEPAFDESRAALYGHGRFWWFARFVRIYRKHRVLRFNGLRRTWQDSRIAAREFARD